MRLPNLAPLGPLSASPEGAQGQLDSSLQLGRVDGQELLLETLCNHLVKDAGVEQPLVGGPGRIVDLPHPRSMPFLSNELAYRAQEVQLQPGECGQPSQSD